MTQILLGWPGGGDLYLEEDDGDLHLEIGDGRVSLSPEDARQMLEMMKVYFAIRRDVWSEDGPDGLTLPGPGGSWSKGGDARADWAPLSAKRKV